MIALQHNVTGEVQIVADAGAYGPEWQLLADPAPADIATAPYLVQGGALVPDLATARARQRAIINAARDAAQDGGCDVPGVGRFDTGERARQFLNGAVAAAQIAMAQGQPFAVSWTLATNDVVQMDGAAIIASGLAVAAHVDAMHQRARVLKARIEAATTLAEIEAIAWTVAD